MKGWMVKNWINLLSCFVVHFLWNAKLGFQESDKKSNITYQNLTCRWITCNIIVCSSRFKNYYLSIKHIGKRTHRSPRWGKLLLKTCYWGPASTEAPVRLNPPLRKRKRTQTNKCAPSKNFLNLVPLFSWSKLGPRPIDHWFHI